MGYFANGTDGLIYGDKHCSKCIHGQGEPCAVWDAHVLYSYELCNSKSNPLDILIPRRADGHNEQCRMFIQRLNDLSEAAAEIERLRAKREDQAMDALIVASMRGVDPESIGE